MTLTINDLLFLLDAVQRRYDALAIEGHEGTILGRTAERLRHHILKEIEHETMKPVRSA